MLDYAASNFRDERAVVKSHGLRSLKEARLALELTISWFTILLTCRVRKLVRCPAIHLHETPSLMEKRNRRSSSPAPVLERTGDVLQDDANLCFPTRCTGRCSPSPYWLRRPSSFGSGLSMTWIATGLHYFMLIVILRFSTSHPKFYVAEGSILADSP